LNAEILVLGTPQVSLDGGAPPLPDGWDHWGQIRHRNIYIGWHGYNVATFSKFEEAERVYDTFATQLKWLVAISFVGLPILMTFWIGLAAGDREATTRGRGKSRQRVSPAFHRFLKHFS
jgi:hypothetical protein